jgi:uroporphyrinogen III methyltransferase/synthase
VGALGRKKLRGKRILLPRSKIAREVIPTELRSLGAKVDVVEVYRTLVPQKGGDRIRRLLREKKIDAITFTSSSTVKNFEEMVGKKKLPSLIKGVALASIGPVTAETMRKCGLKATSLDQAWNLWSPALSSILRRKKGSCPIYWTNIG